VDEIDAYRCAALLIQQHGMQALTRATLRRLEMMDGGDLAGADAWMRIINSIRTLRRMEREQSEPLQ